MSTEELDLRVTVVADGFDAEALDEYVAALREELGDLDVAAIGSVPAGEAPPGTKGLPLVAIGALVMRLARSRKLLEQVVDAVRDWLTRNHLDTIRLEIDGDVIELTGALPEERSVLIDTWVRQHSGP